MFDLQMTLTLLFALIGLVHHAVGYKVLVIGDWGQELTSSSRPSQERVARAMGKYLEANPDIQYIISTGDNFYPSGVTSPDSPRFDTSWRDLYQVPEYPVMASKKWYISVGNHDHTDNWDELNQVSFGDNEDLWEFPWLWYDWVAQGDGFTVHWIVLDSQALRHAKHNPAAQLQWLEETLASSTADYVAVVAHHPMFNAGRHGGSSTMRNNVLPLMQQYNADFYIVGHDHNLQHINPEDYESQSNYIDHILSGGGGRVLYNIEPNNLNDLRNRGQELRHFEFDWGVVTMDFTATGVTIDYYSPDSNDEFQLVYSFTRDQQRP